MSIFAENNDGENVPKAKGYCAPYNGQVCRKYLQGRGLVWFNISQDNSGGWLNEQITQNLWDELISKLKPPCRDAAEALLCKYAFPDCTLNEGIGEILVNKMVDERSLQQIFHVKFKVISNVIDVTYAALEWLLIGAIILHVKHIKFLYAFFSI